MIFKEREVSSNLQVTEMRVLRKIAGVTRMYTMLYKNDMTVREGLRQNSTKEAGEERMLEGEGTEQ